MTAQIECTDLVRIFSADERTYCLGGRKDTSTYYYSSDTGLSTIPCT